MSTKIRILIADDHPLILQGLRQAIEADPAFEIVHEASDGRAALHFLRELKPQLCVLDINMPVLDGLGVVRQLRQQRLAVEVIFLTMYKEADLLQAAMDLDIKGFMLKDNATSDILHCLHSVAAGHRYLSPALSDLLFSSRAGGQALRQEKPALERLTPTERVILKHIAQDKTSKEIANELGLSPRTVENHRTNMCAKLDVHGIHSLVKFAYENKARL
jgi:DNA-binding NarL/FixJ family response regulator